MSNELTPEIISNYMKYVNAEGIIKSKITELAFMVRNIDNRFRFSYYGLKKENGGNDWDDYSLSSVNLDKEEGVVFCEIKNDENERIDNVGFPITFLTMEAHQAAYKYESMMERRLGND